MTIYRRWPGEDSWKRSYLNNSNSMERGDERKCQKVIVLIKGTHNRQEC